MSSYRLVEIKPTILSAMLTSVKDSLDRILAAPTTSETFKSAVLGLTPMDPKTELSRV